MSILTEVLKLFCYDPETDGANTFNIPKALNENWEKIDQLVLLAVAAAAAYDPEGSYALGDYCTHGGKLHKCNTPIPSGEAWNAEHWTETSVAVELAGKADAISPEETPLPLSNGVSPSTLHGGYKCVFRKDQCGKVYITLGVQGNFINGQSIFTLPEDCRPNGNVVINSYVNGYSSFLEIGTDGIGKIYTDVTAAEFSNIYASGVFYAAQ